MVEINKEWLHYSDIDVYQELISFTNDVERTQTHLYLVEKQLRENPPAGLSQQQLKKRNHALDLLKRYYNNKRFPINDYHSVRQPYFIDDHGTACAVGHLIIETGLESVAKKIAQENNYAYVHELKSLYPELTLWAESNGFTIAELAWIQPGYPPHNQVWNAVGNGGGPNGTINVMKSYLDEILYIAGDFTEIDGVEANSIIGWNGNAWFYLGAGIEGTINDLFVDEDGRLFAGGNFYVIDDPSIKNVAYWYNNQWNGFNTQNMTGTVHTIHAMDSKLYIGGSFEIEYSNQSINNLAFVDLNQSNFGNQNGDFSLDSTVYDIVEDNGVLYIAGAFFNTAPASGNSSIHQEATDQLAVWGYDTAINTYNWIQTFEQEMGTLNSLYVSNEYTYLGANNNNSDIDGIGILDTSLEYWPLSQIDSSEASLVEGFINHSGILVAYGNLIPEFIVGTFSTGIIILENSVNQTNGAHFNSAITAAESFQGQLYFAGDFTTVQELEFPGLVSSPFDGVTGTSELFDNSELNVYSSPTQVHIQYEQLNEDFEITFYNLSGKQLSSTILPQGNAEIDITTQNWTAGIYVYQAVSTSGQTVSGKVFIK